MRKNSHMKKTIPRRAIEDSHGDGGIAKDMQMRMEGSRMTGHQEMDRRKKRHVRERGGRGSSRG